MKIIVKEGLPFIQVTVGHNCKELKLNYVLIDTGSAGTIFNADLLRNIDITSEGNDVIFSIRGVGGYEYVYSKTLDWIRLGDNIQCTQFQIEIGEMDYGMQIDGILGFDFIQSVGLIIDTKNSVIHQG